MTTPRSASAALMPLDEARARLIAGVKPVASRRVAPGAAIGAICAGDPTAPADRPACRVALRDGWAVSFGEIAGASPYAPVALAQLPVWVEAGDVLPESADTILAHEAVEAGPNRMEVVADAPEGEATRAAGGEISAGAPIAGAGRRVTALHALAFAAAGLTEIAIRTPRIRLVATGTDPTARMVADMVAAVAAAEGCAIDGIADASDDVAAIADALRSGSADTVFVVGGTGFGRTDRSAAALAQAGALTAHGIALLPGETSGFGTAEGRSVLLLPGRPEAALAGFLALGRPLLAALSGLSSATPPSGPLLRKIASGIGLSEIVFVRATPGGLEPLGGAELPLHRLLLADGAVLVPPDREGYPEGMTVPWMPL